MKYSGTALSTASAIITVGLLLIIGLANNRFFSCLGTRLDLQDDDCYNVSVSSYQDKQQTHVWSRMLLFYVSSRISLTLIYVDGYIYIYNVFVLEAIYWAIDTRRTFPGRLL